MCHLGFLAGKGTIHAASTLGKPLGGLKGGLQLGLQWPQTRSTAWPAEGAASHCHGQEGCRRMPLGLWTSKHSAVGGTKETGSPYLCPSTPFIKLVTHRIVPCRKSDCPFSISGHSGKTLSTHWEPHTSTANSFAVQPLKCPFVTGLFH